MFPELPPSPDAEWLEADGLGGFASGTVSGIRTRRYHGLLVPATAPPAGRAVLVNGFEAWIEVFGETIAISSQRYAPDVLYPDGASRLSSFVLDPWPVCTLYRSSLQSMEPRLSRFPGSCAAISPVQRSCESVRCFRDATFTPSITRTARSASKRLKLPMQ